MKLPGTWKSIIHKHTNIRLNHPIKENRNSATNEDNINNTAIIDISNSNITFNSLL